MKYHDQSTSVLTQGAIMLEALREKNLLQRLALVSGLELPKKPGYETRAERIDRV